MSSPNIPTLKTLFDPPPRPSSTGPASRSTAHPSDPSLPSHASVSTKTAHVARPSAFSIRTDLSQVQTRIRARSINSGKGASVPIVLSQLEPTLAGSPVLPTFDTFLRQQQAPGSAPYNETGPLTKVRTGQVEGWSPRSAHSGSGAETDDFDPTPSVTETGSTRSDSPLETPRDSDLEPDEVPSFRLEGPSRRGSSAEREERELWRLKGEADEDLKTVEGRHRSKSLEGMTRMGLRRGRSFTSLLKEPPKLSSPKFERNKELYQPPNPILETYEFESKPPSPEPVELASSFSTTTSLYPPPSLADVSSELASLPTPTKSLRDFVPQLVILVSLFFSSFAVIFFFISTLPGLFLPHSVADLPALTATLSTYRSSSFLAELHLFGVLTLLFLWKQCFSIPGSVLTNILFGALYGTTMGTLWACVWTATGSTGAYLIALVIAPLVEYYFATPLAMTRRALKLPDPTASPSPSHSTPAVVPISGSDLFSHLLLARFFPLLPYSVLNVISGVLRLPLGPFFVTLLIGSFPFNFATVSIGNLVALAASDPSTPLGDKIWSREVVLKLVAVTLISVIPLAFKEHLKRALSNGGFVERVKSAVARMLFGFGAVPSTVHVSTTVTPYTAVPGGAAGGGGGGGGGRRGWQRKFKASIGSASDFVAQGFMLGPGRRNAYERVASDVGLPHFADGVDDAELGGVR